MLSLRFCYFLTYIRSIVIIRKRSTLSFLENIHPLNLFSQYSNIFFNSHLLNSEDKKYVTERRFYIKTKIIFILRGIFFNHHSNATHFNSNGLWRSFSLSIQTAYLILVYWTLKTNRTYSMKIVSSSRHLASVRFRGLPDSCTLVRWFYPVRKSRQININAVQSEAASLQSWERLLWFI